MDNILFSEITTPFLFPDVSGKKWKVETTCITVNYFEGLCSYVLIKEQALYN